MAVDEVKSEMLVHAAGKSCLDFSTDGHYLVTGGDEGYIRIFDMTLEQQASEERNRCNEYHEDVVSSVAVSSEYICSGGESGIVALHKVAPVPESEQDSHGFVSLLTRCSFPVRSIKFDSKGKRVAVASDELIVKVIDVNDSTKVQLLTGHKQGVRQVTWSPDGALITTATSDGAIRVWDMNSSEPTCIQVLEDLIAAAKPEDIGTVEPVWHPSGKFLVVATKTNELVVISRDTWQRTGAFAKDGHTDVISAFAFSDNGRYLVSTSVDGTVLVWDVPDRRVIARETHRKPITQIAFSPDRNANLICWMDNNGWLVRWKEPIPSNLPAPAAPLHARNASVDSTAIVDKSAQRERAQTAKTKPANAAHAPIPDESDVGNDDGFDADGWLDDDDGLLAEAGVDDMDEDSRPSGKDRAITSWLESGHRKASSNAYVPPVPKGQEPFQPGSTPLREQRRYLAFNMLGVISTVEREDHNLVTIEFHDRSAHVGSHFNDSFRFTLGAIGHQGCAFACGSSGDSPGQIYYRSYENWSTAQEWQYELLAKESPVLLAVGGVEGTSEYDLSIAGSGTVIVATDKGYIRFLTGSGLQKYLWNLGHEVVTMAAGNEWVVVVYRSIGGVVDGRQNLEYALMDIDTFEIVQEGSVPLAKGARLKWIGFTDEQVPAIYDSQGLLSVLDRSRRPRQARWVPSLDTNTLARRENKQEAYWPVGVTARHLHAVILKGEEQHPHFPVPVFQELELQLPLLRLEVQQGQMEAKYLRETMFVTHRRDGAAPDDEELKSSIARQELETDKTVLLLVQSACKADRLEAALDAVLMLSQPASVAAAAKIAHFYNLPSLEDRIELVKEAKTGMRSFENDNKREGKWAHLMDDRTIVTANRHGSRGDGNLFGGGMGGMGGGRHARVDSSMPPMSFTPRPSSVLNRGHVETPRSTAVSVSAVEQADEETWDAEGDESTNVDDDHGYERSNAAAQSSSPKRARSASVDAEAMAAPPKKAVNPFAKRAAVLASSSPANPFASKNKAGAKDLTRTGSFFNRIEGKEAPKPKGKERSSLSNETAAARSGTGSRQTTLFGMAPPVAAEAGPKSKAGRKRKAVTDNGETAEAEPTSASVTVLAKKPVSQADKVKELPREGEEFEDTQMEDTQIDETQPAQSFEKDERGNSDKENVSVSSGTASKLAKFRMQQNAPESTVSNATTEAALTTENVREVVTLADADPTESAEA
ncbi:DNA polymerase alpha accessory factor Mcl1 [Microbotryomycetes sp. JL201]|nr:DNA polymerase alpha accessory factor Mcl1 [Microbotryomycetes sp. JL201]